MTQQFVLNKIGQGMRLRRAHVDGSFSLVDGFPLAGGPRPYAIPVPPEVAEPLLSGPFSVILAKLARDNRDQKYGWLEMGLDGEQADFYALVR